jgi:hypothetical protein
MLSIRILKNEDWEEGRLLSENKDSRLTKGTIWQEIADCCKTYTK